MVYTNQNAAVSRSCLSYMCVCVWVCGCECACLFQKPLCFGAATIHSIAIAIVILQATKHDPVVMDWTRAQTQTFDYKNNVNVFERYKPSIAFLVLVQFVGYFFFCMDQIRNGWLISEIKLKKYVRRSPSTASPICPGYHLFLYFLSAGDFVLLPFFYFMLVWPR